MINEDAHEAVRQDEKNGSSASTQVVMALALGGVVLLGLLGAKVIGGAPAPDGKPAACSAPKATDSPEYPALCAALNRADLPVLLGTPKEHVSIAQPGGGQITHADGTKEFDDSAQVQIGPVCVKVTDNHDLPVKDLADFPNLLAERTTVLGHPAMSYTDHSMALIFNGKSSSVGTGGVARHIVVAKDAKDGGGSFEFVIWRQDDVSPDGTALAQVVDKVLPTLPGWVAGS